MQPDEERFIATIDGTHCRIREQRSDPNSNWYSHKYNGPALNYELAIDLNESKLIWINGPYRAGVPDITVFRKPDGFKEKIPGRTQVIGDRGYRGEPTKISTPNPHDSEVAGGYKRRARARHESFNQRIKIFKILDSKFRHDIEKHKVAFEAVCVIVQYDMKNGHPLFEI